VKEDVYRRFERIRNRFGFLRSVLWVALIMYFAWKQSRPDSIYPELPPLVVETTLITIGVWVLGKFIAPKRAVKHWIGLLEGWAYKFNPTDGE